MKTTRLKTGETVLLGQGLDNTDGHKRLTRGDGILIAGGSEETHGRMAETAIKAQEELRRRGKDIRTADPREVMEAVQKHAPR